MNSTWTQQYDNNDMMWPAEPLIRIFKGRNYPDCHIYKNKFSEASLLDVGCGDANNFPLYSQLGFQRICGVEITREICDLNQKRLNKLGIEAEMRVGTNDSIPYDEQFDYLISWNSCYYMGEANNYFKFEDYLREYSRVLKRNGIFIFSVPASDHRIFLDSKSIDNKYSIIQNDPLGIRKNIVFRKFNSEEDIKECFGQYFNNIFLGEINDNYFGTRGHWHIGYCHKK